LDSKDFTALKVMQLDGVDMIPMKMRVYAPKVFSLLQEKD
jgi:hypothetical protein